jgi:hypothetical protein
MVEIEITIGKIKLLIKLSATILELKRIAALFYVNISTSKA